ncbi:MULTISPECIES: HNH endonuclease [Citrobacter freundii complex]|uniref:HNH endonuclease n=1 Tax=Citrobacter freundii complex TaxID=1344959 RepID=UPI000B181B11|nr:HNH endonuclease [Citrobacter braakii]
MSRLNPKSTTLRTLFLRSGNQCAFPECNVELVNAYDQYVGNVCHIEAAEEGGERYNVSQSDEDRRSYSNLILLCANHHKITDDVKMYPVHILQSMKMKHESNFHEKSIADNKISAFVNSTHDETINLPQNLNKIQSSILEYFQEYELSGLVGHAQDYFSRFKGIPEATRTLYAQLLLLSESTDSCTIIDLRIVPQYLNVKMESLYVHYKILENKGLLSDEIIDDDVYPVRAYRVFTTFDRDDMQAWLLQSIRNYYQQNQQYADFVELVTDLNFNLMDS